MLPNFFHRVLIGEAFRGGKARLDSRPRGSEEITEIDGIFTVVAALFWAKPLGSSLDGPGVRNYIVNDSDPQSNGFPF